MSLPTLPNELIYQVIHNIIHTPAVFIFDLFLGPLPHPPILPRGCNVCFRPVTSQHVKWGAIRWSRPSPSPFPGTFESAISKTIRSLLLTSHGIRAECLKHLSAIPVPTMQNRCRLVHFNPSAHIICLDEIHFAYRQQPGKDIWARRDTDLWCDVELDIEHLAFLWNLGEIWQSGQAVTTLSYILPGIKHVYGAVIHMPRSHPDRYLDVVLPEDQPKRFSPIFMYMAKRYWNLTARAILDEDGSANNYKLVPPFTDTIQDIELEGLVLI